jgi:hypothetical protein
MEPTLTKKPQRWLAEVIFGVLKKFCLGWKKFSQRTNSGNDSNTEVARHAVRIDL